MSHEEYPEKIVQLLGINNIEVDIEEAELFIEKEKNDGVVVDLDPQELMHLLDEYTEMDFGPDKIYGIDTDEVEE